MRGFQGRFRWFQKRLGPILRVFGTFLGFQEVSVTFHGVPGGFRGLLGDVLGVSKKSQGNSGGFQRCFRCFEEVWGSPEAFEDDSRN